jgi:hypothetical protein
MIDDRLDIFPFSELALADPINNTIEIWWCDPREIEEIVLQFEFPKNKINSCDNIFPTKIIKKLSYWRNTWPKNRPDPKIVRGSGRSGWQTQDDLYRGIWEDADINIHSDEETQNTLRISFNDLQNKEFPMEKFSTHRRRTLKCKLYFNPKEITINQIKACQIFTPTKLTKHKFTILSNNKDSFKNKLPSMHIFNGFFPNYQITENEFKIGAEYSILGAIPQYSEDYDGTLITLLTDQKENGFTFSLQDLLKEKSIVIPELGFAVIQENTGQFYENLSKSRQGKTILSQVRESPLRQLDDALKEFQGKLSFYAVIGCDGVRAKCAVTPEGFLSVGSQFMRKVVHADTPRLYWHKEYSQWQFLWGID